MPDPASFIALREGAFVPAPVPGTHVSVISVPGGNLIFGFDPSYALATRPEGSFDLVLHLDHGGTVTLGSFFESYDGTFPLLILPDGEVLAAIDFLQVFDLDMQTAAGPEYRLAGGGLNEYADASGTGEMLTVSATRLGFSPDPEADDPRETSLTANFAENLSSAVEVPSEEAWHPILSGEIDMSMLHDADYGDVFFGGSDNDTFAWTRVDLTSAGQSRIMDFSLGEDRLRFEDYFDGEDLTDGIFEKLTSTDSDSLWLSNVSEKGLCLNVGDHTIEVKFSGHGLAYDQVELLNSEDPAAQATALIELFSSTGG